MTQQKLSETCFPQRVDCHLRWLSSMLVETLQDLLNVNSFFPFEMIAFNLLWLSNVLVLKRYNFAGHA